MKYVIKLWYENGGIIERVVKGAKERDEAIKEYRRCKSIVSIAVFRVEKTGDYLIKSY